MTRDIGDLRTLAKSKAPKFCEACGTELNDLTVETVSYDAHTGKRSVDAKQKEMVCPSGHQVWEFYDELSKWVLVTDIR